MQFTSREFRIWLLCGTAVLTLGSAPVYAQQSAKPVPAAATAAQAFTSARVAYDIPPGALEPALKKWAELSGLKLLVPSNHLVAVGTQGLAGTFTPEQALKLLLKPTTLKYSLSGVRSIAVFDPTNSRDAHAQVTTLPAITVEGELPKTNSTMIAPPVYAGGQVATGGQLGFLGNVGVMNTPFNQTSYTTKMIEDRQAVSVRDALQFDPSVRTYTSSVLPYDNITIRGFNINSGDVSMNGLYGMVPTSYASSIFVERVEVLKGPSALLNGMPINGSVGGTVNLVTKRATDDPITRLTTSYSSDARAGTHIDLGRRFGDNKEFGIRFNGAFAKGDGPIDDNKDKLGVAALGLDYRGERLRVSVDAGYQDRTVDNIQNSIQAPATIAAIPTPPPNDRSYIGPWTYVKTKDQFGMARAEFDITPDIMLYAAAGAHEYKTQQAFGSFPQLTAAANGNFTYTPSGYAGRFLELAGQTGIRARVETGPVSHLLNANFSTVQRDNKNATVSGTLRASNIYNPVYISPPITIPNPLRVSVTQLSSYGVSDTMSVLNERIQLTLGVRKQQVTTDAYAGGAYRSTYDSGKVSPAFAILLKPWSNVSVYANYIEGLQAGSVVQAPSLNVGEVLPPQPTKQKEVGVKLDWGRFTTTFSAFDIEQPNTITTAGILSYNGRQRNRGLEFNFFGEVTEGVRLLGGAMVLDSIQAKTVNGTNDGRIVVGAPNHQINLGADVDIPMVRGLSVNGLAVHTGPQYVNAVNTLSIPSWTRYDLGARYEFVGLWDRPMVFRFNVQNVANANYWESSINSFLILNNPRTYHASLTTSF
ncbi:MAG: TonB-dependent siderophore receptor [Pseudolabrys sp.]|nr:TonB-dependent siderophore receptor [Pseudolabrys sp.]